MNKDLLDKIKSISGGEYNKFRLIIFLGTIDAILASIGLSLLIPIIQGLQSDGQYQNFVVNYLYDNNIIEPDGNPLYVVLCGAIAFFTFKFLYSTFLTVYTARFCQSVRENCVNKIGGVYLKTETLDFFRKANGTLINDWNQETLVISRFLRNSIKYITSAIIIFSLVILGLFINTSLMLMVISVGTIFYYLLSKLLYKNPTNCQLQKLNLIKI